MYYKIYFVFIYNSRIDEAHLCSILRGTHIIEDKNHSQQQQQVETTTRMMIEENSFNLKERMQYNTIQLIHDPIYRYAHEKLDHIGKHSNNVNRRVKEHLKKEKSKSHKTGDDKMNDLKYWLDNLGLHRKEHQIRFHERMIRACLTKIYADEWETQYEQIMKRYGIQKMQRECLLSCPRRFGKTYAVAIFCAAFLVSIPNCEIAVFATGKRTAKKLMVLILSFLENYPDIAKYVKTKNQEDLVLDFGLNDKRKLSCYPSSVKVMLLLLLFNFSFF